MAVRRPAREVFEVVSSDDEAPLPPPPKVEAALYAERIRTGNTPSSVVSVKREPMDVDNAGGARRAPAAPERAASSSSAGQQPGCRPATASDDEDSDDPLSSPAGLAAATEGTSPAKKAIEKPKAGQASKNASPAKSAVSPGTENRRPAGHQTISRTIATDVAPLSMDMNLKKSATPPSQHGSASQPLCPPDSQQSTMPKRAKSIKRKRVDHSSDDDDEDPDFKTNYRGGAGFSRSARSRVKSEDESTSTTKPAVLYKSTSAPPQQVVNDEDDEEMDDGPGEEADSVTGSGGPSGLSASMPDGSPAEAGPPAVSK